MIGLELMGRTWDTPVFDRHIRLNAEIAKLESILSQIAEESERLRVEIGEEPRVSVLQTALVRCKPLLW